MYKVYKHFRDGSSQLVGEFRYKKYALKESKTQQRYFVDKSLGLFHDFDVVRITVKKGRKIIHDKKEKI